MVVNDMSRRKLNVQNEFHQNTGRAHHDTFLTTFLFALKYAYLGLYLKETNLFENSI